MRLFTQLLQPESSWAMRSGRPRKACRRSWSDFLQESHESTHGFETGLSKRRPMMGGKERVSRSNRASHPLQGPALSQTGLHCRQSTFGRNEMGGASTPLALTKVFDLTTDEWHIDTEQLPAGHSIEMYAQLAAISSPPLIGLSARSPVTLVLDQVQRTLRGRGICSQRETPLLQHYPKSPDSTC
jgi:hypothetical protein